MNNLNRFIIIISILFITSLSSLSFAVLTDGLISYYKADEVSSDYNLSDSLGNYNFNQSNSPSTSNGIISGSRILSNSGTKYFTRNNNFFQVGSNDFTITMWLNFTATTNGYIYHSGITGTSTGIQIRVAAGVLYFDTLVNGASVITVTGENIVTGNWKFYEFRRNSTGQYIIVNRTTTYSQTGSPNNINLATTGAIGCFIQSGVCQAGNYPDVKIDEIGFWNRTLTQSESNSLYNGGVGLTYPFNPIIINSINITPLTARDNDDLNVSFNSTGGINGTLNCSDESGYIYNQFFQPIGVNNSIISNSLTTFGRNVTCNLTIFNSTFSSSMLSNTVFINNSLNPIIINSINITARYSNYNNTIDYAYWNVKNFTVNYNVTSSDNISINILKNGITVSNNSFTNVTVSYGDNVSFILTAFNSTYNATVSKNITILSGILNNLTLYLNYNNFSLFNYSTISNYSYMNYVNSYWFVNNSLVINNTSNIDVSYLYNHIGEPIRYVLELENNQLGTYYNYSVNSTVLYPVYLNNTLFVVDLLNISKTDLNFTVDVYIPFTLSVNSTNDINTPNEQVWYQWFLDGVNIVSGWGKNVLNYFFEISQLGNHNISVNATLTPNSTESIWSNTITWNINVTKPILEPNTLEISSEEIYDSMQIMCNHNYTGHKWSYEIEVNATLKDESTAWIPVSNGISDSGFVIADLTSFNNSPNYQVRCRTWNDYFNYSNWTYYPNNIEKKEKNQIKMFMKIPQPKFTNQVYSFSTECDMTHNDKYRIKEHWTDYTSDGIYDDLKSYNSSEEVTLSYFGFTMMWLTQGNYTMNTGCIIEKRTNDLWDFSYCKEDKTTCAIQKSYVMTVMK